MELYKENGTVILRRDGKKPDAVRIIKKTNLQGQSRDFSVSGKPSMSAYRSEHNFVVKGGVDSRIDLTNKEFSVTRARAHARAYARENNRVEVKKENPGLRRVLDAALSGNDVKVAAIEPMSFGSRIIALLLIPIMLISPILPAYANEAPLAERVATDVAQILDTPSASIASSEPQVDVSPTLDTQTEPTTSATESSDVVSNPDTEIASTDPSVTSNLNEVSSGEVAGASSSSGSENVAPQGEASSSDATPDTSAGAQTSSGGGESASLDTSVPANSELSQNSQQETSSSTVIADEIQVPIDETLVESNPEDTQVIDIASPEVQEDLQTIKARLREEIKNQVRNELKKEVEREVYNGCKNLDGVGYYCVPDAKSFGSVIVENDRKISVSVQSDPSEGDKEIFLERDNVAIQLTHNADDDAFPVLDPTSDLLVWQSLVNGHWQIAYAHVNDVGVPKVNYLTNGENNFNPKVYRGRIVWQAWVDGSWEIFTVVKSQEKIDDDSLTAEHRAAGVDGSWNIKRITANNVPDMFPSLTSDSITWQSIDDGVWQVFAYDLVDGTTKRVSKKGVRSESPRTALVWNEEDETGQIRLVGSDVNNSESIDFTALARRIVDRSREEPKTPVTNTEIIVEKPTTARAEDEVVVLQ